jgi:hypothetical protein
MFRSLYESFEDASGAPDSQQFINNYFTNSVPAPLNTLLPADQVPSPIPAENQATMDILDRPGVRRLLGAATATMINGQVYKPLSENPVDRFNALRVPGPLIVAQQKCKTMSFDDVVAAAPDRDLYGCGWFVDPANIKTANNNGKPFLGTPAGPLNVLNDKIPSGKFYYNMDELQRDMHIAQATDIRSCDALKGSPNASKFGWCLTNAKAIAVDNKGRALYKDANGRPECEPERIVLAGAECPKNDPAATGNNNNNNTTVRNPDGTTTVMPSNCENNSLSRDCVIQNLRQIGCKDQGSLMQALATGLNNRDYIGNLKNDKAFLAYQSVAPNKLNPNIFAAGNDTVENSLDNFRGLHSQATTAAAANAPVTSLGYAAIDLCLAKGKFLEYDKCMELTESSPPPYDLECMQKAFKLAGGQGAGAMYPNTGNKTMYESQNQTWGQLLATFRDLKEKTSSSDVAVQEKALRDFLGINRSSLNRITLSKIDGYEVYNFASVSNALDIIFTGRRIMSSQDLQGYKGGLPAFSGFTSPNQYLQNLEPSFVIITDLRPNNALADNQVQFGFTAKDGIVLTVNKDMTNYQTQLIGNEPNDFRNNRQRQMREFIYNKACTTLNPLGNNRLKVYWNSKLAGASKAFEMFWSTCNPNGNFNGALKIPNEWISLTQGRYAPILSFQASQAQFGERRMPEFFPVQTSSVVVDMSNKDANPGKIPIARFTGPSSQFRVTKIMTASSFTSLSICFRITQPVSSAVGDLIFSLGGIGIFARTGNIITTLVGNKNADFRYDQGKWYYMLLEFSGGSGAQNTALNISIYPVDTVAAGEATLKEMTNNMSINYGSPILSELSQTNVLTLGKNMFGDSEFNGAVMDVAWVHVFDYAFRGLPEQEIKNRLQRDANSSWPINWY